MNPVDHSQTNSNPYSNYTAIDLKDEKTPLLSTTQWISTEPTKDSKWGAAADKIQELGMKVLSFAGKAFESVKKFVITIDLSQSLEKAASLASSIYKKFAGNSKDAHYENISRINEPPNTSLFDDNDGETIDWQKDGGIK